MDWIVALIASLLFAESGSAMQRWSCRNVTPPPRGRMETISYGVFAKNTAMFRFSCDEGYTLKGQCVALCVDGIVLQGKPQCIDTFQCPTVRHPANGRLRQLTNGEVLARSQDMDPEKTYTMLNAMAIASADNLGSFKERYDLVFELRSTLETMQIMRRQQVALSAKSVDSDAPAPLFAVKCRPGFVPEGPIFYKYCHLGAFLPTAAPNCVAEPKCPDLVAPRNGAVHVYQSYKTGQGAAIYTCDRGFKLDAPTGNLVRCGADNRWSSETTPRCRLACPAVENPPNGRLIWRGGSWLLLCNPGFVLQGPSTIYCNANDGSWGMQNSLCLSRTPCRHVEDRRPREQVAIGTLQNLTPIKKSKSNVFATCAGYPACPAPYHPTNGKFSLLGEYEPPAPLSKLHFSCRGGYRLQGAASMTCGPGGKWTAEFPTCRRDVSCPRMSRIQHGYMYWANSVPQNERYSALLFICTEGFEIKGDPLLFCFDGKWLGQKPRCERTGVKRCPMIRSPSNGMVEPMLSGPAPHSTTLSFTCDRGFKLVGSASINCLSNGKWNTAVPTCEALCPIPRPFPGGSVTYPVLFGFHPRAFARFECDDGGEAYAECGIDGEWTQALPTCEEPKKRCPALREPTGGKIKTVEGESNEQIALFSCDEGFVLIGAPYIKCTEVGVWLTEPPLCKENKPCPAIPQDTRDGRKIRDYRLRNLVPGEDIRLDTTATFTCALGFTLEGVRELQCLEGGKWSAPFPTCTETPAAPGGFIIGEGPVDFRG